MALGPTSRALQDQGPETRAAVATSIHRALQLYQRGKQFALAGQSGLSRRTTRSAWSRTVAADGFARHEHFTIRIQSAFFCLFGKNGGWADRGSLTAVPETLRDGRWSERMIAVDVAIAHRGARDVAGRSMVAGRRGD